MLKAYSLWARWLPGPWNWKRSIGLVLIASAALLTLLQLIPNSEWEQFEQIKVGMSRSEVEQILGKPQLEFGDKAYFGSMPRLELWQSPQSIWRIAVTYTNEQLTEKEFFKDQKLPLYKKVWRKIREFSGY